MHRVLVVQVLHPAALDLLEARADVRYDVVPEPSEAALLAAVDGIEAITLRDAPLPPSVVEAATSLRVISRHGVGLDNVPIDLCTELGIAVTTVGPVNAVSVAEHAVLLMLAAARSAVELDAAVRDGDFGARNRIRQLELQGSTVLLIGYGRVGREVARRCQAFGMRVLVHDPYVAADPGPGVELVPELDDALRQAAVVSVHVPLTPGTRHLLGARELDLLPAGAIVVNTSRGGVVDEAALLAAVRSGHLHGAGIDTFETEPLPSDSPLTAERRIVLSPHAAALTEQAYLAMGLVTVQNALAGLDGTLDRALVVNPSVLDPSGAPRRQGGNVG